MDELFKIILDLPRYKPQVHWRSREFSGMRQEVIPGHELLGEEGEFISLNDLTEALSKINVRYIHE